jgi:cytidylate kinase
MDNNKIIIAIDGFSACGKSTLAKALATRLGYRYIDTGAMYRAITLYFLRNGISTSDESAVADALENIHLTFVPNEKTGASEIHLNDENIAVPIRDMIVAEKVSEVAAVKAVRTFLVAQQKRIGGKRGVVMDGRDIGTVVFPDAELKVFMTADPAIRVLRRYDEMAAVNPAIQLEEVKHNLELRDYIDSNREESPLRQAEDALILDNTHLTREQQLATVIRWVAERTQPVANNSVNG